MTKHEYQERMRACFEAAESAQHTFQFPLALRLYRRCISLGRRWQGRSPGYFVRGTVVAAELRYAQMLMYCGSISRGADLGLRTVKRLANALPAIRLPQGMLRFVRDEMLWTEAVCSQHKKELNSPLWILEPKLFEAVLHIVSKHDPVGIASVGQNPSAWTEYAPEAAAIIPQLKYASNAGEVEKIVHQVFRYHFGASSRKLDAATSSIEQGSGKNVGGYSRPFRDFRPIAAEIWKCLQRRELRRALANVVDVESPIKNAVRRTLSLRQKGDDRLRLALIASLKDRARRLEAWQSEPLLRAVLGKAAEATRP